MNFVGDDAERRVSFVVKLSNGYLQHVSSIYQNISIYQDPHALVQERGRV